MSGILSPHVEFDLKRTIVLQISFGVFRIERTTILVFDALDCGCNLCQSTNYTRAGLAQSV
jgi:hypothetical protein